MTRLTKGMATVSVAMAASAGVWIYHRSAVKPSNPAPAVSGVISSPTIEQPTKPSQPASPQAPVLQTLRKPSASIVSGVTVPGSDTGSFGLGVDEALVIALEGKPGDVLTARNILRPKSYNGIQFGNNVSYELARDDNGNQAKLPPGVTLTFTPRTFNTSMCPDTGPPCEGILQVLLDNTTPVGDYGIPIVAVSGAGNDWMFIHLIVSQ